MTSRVSITCQYTINRDSTPPHQYILTCAIEVKFVTKSEMCIYVILHFSSKIVIGKNLQQWRSNDVTAVCFHFCQL